MSVPREHVRYIIFYEWRRGTEATAAVRNTNSVWREGHHFHRYGPSPFARFKDGDTDFEDKPYSGRSLAVNDSVILDTVREDQEVNTRGLATRLGCAQSTILGRLQASGYEKC